MTPETAAARPTAAITLAGARTAIGAALREAEGLAVSVIVHVVDPGGHMVAMARMGDAPLLSIGVARDKAWTVIAFGKPTDWWATAFEEEPGLSALANGRPLMPVPGGVPLKVDGELVGAIGVSGASATQDHQIAEAAARAVS